jgi:threonine/homoserine/homoserine lactone efflux protein
MVASSGANFGVARTGPHILGIAFGFPLMIFGVGVFLGQVFEASPALREILRFAGAGLMLWIAWQIGKSGGLPGIDGGARPMRFVEAAAFQWVNPKAWAMAIAVTSQFVTSENALVAIPIISGAYILAAISGTTGWAALGSAIQRKFGSPGQLAWFNRTMALLIVFSVGTLFLG